MEGTNDGNLQLPAIWEMQVWLPSKDKSSLRFPFFLRLVKQGLECREKFEVATPNP